MEEDTGARGHSQALDDALQLDGLAPEGVVSAVAPGRPHHLGPLVPHDRVGWEKEKERNNKQGGVGEKDSHICKESCVLLTRRWNGGSSDTCTRSGDFPPPHLPTCFFFLYFPNGAQTGLMLTCASLSDL